MLTPIMYPMKGTTAYTPYYTIFDPKLKPQNTRSYEVGTDINFLDNLITFSYTYSRQNVKDQIFEVPLASSTGASKLLTNGGIALDDSAKSVTVDGDRVNLTPLEYNILLLLLKNPGRVFSTSQIYELVWNDPSLGSENTVAVHIRHLREKIEIDPANPRYIKVVWGLGYKMEKI